MASERKAPRCPWCTSDRWTSVTIEGRVMAQCALCEAIHNDLGEADDPAKVDETRREVERLKEELGLADDPQALHAALAAAERMRDGITGLATREAAPTMSEHTPLTDAEREQMHRSAVERDGGEYGPEAARQAEDTLRLLAEVDRLRFENAALRIEPSAARWDEIVAEKNGLIEQVEGLRTELAETRSEGSRLHRSLRQTARQIEADRDDLAAKLEAAEEGLAKARADHGPICGAHVYWWDGEYDDNCELPKYHGGPHYDGLSWFNDDNEEVDPPALSEDGGSTDG